MYVEKREIQLVLYCHSNALAVVVENISMLGS